MGLNFHSFSVVILGYWTATEQTDFVYFELQVVTETCEIHVSGAKYIGDCTTHLLTPLLISELAAIHLPHFKWHLIPRLFKNFPNIEGVRIDLKTSFIVFQKSEPMLAPGMRNAGLKKFLRETLQWPSAGLREDCKLLMEEMVKHGKCKLVIECDCDLTNFGWTGCAEDLETLKLLCIQGKDDHAMVQRIFCDFRKLSFDRSVAEKHVPQRHRL